MRMEKARKVSVRGMDRRELSFAVHSFGLFHLLQVFICSLLYLIKFNIITLKV